MSDFYFEPRGRQMFQQQHQYPDQGIDLFREVRDLVFSGGQNHRGCDRDRGCGPRDFDQFDRSGRSDPYDRYDRMNMQRDSIPWSRGDQIFNRHNSCNTHNRFNTQPGCERQYYPEGRHRPQSDYYQDRNDFGRRHRPGSFQPFQRHQNQDLGRQIINRVVVPLIMNEIFGHRQRYQPGRFRRW